MSSVRRKAASLAVLLSKVVLRSSAADGRLVVSLSKHFLINYDNGTVSRCGTCPFR